IRQMESENRYDQLEAMARRDFISAMDAYSRGEDFFDKAERSDRRSETDQANSYRSQGRDKYEQAVEEMEFIDRYYKHFSRRGDLLFIWGDSLFKLEEYHDAKNILRDLISEISSYTKMGDTLLTLGECYFATEDYDDAAQYYEQVVAKYSDLRSTYKNAMKRLEWINYYWGIREFEYGNYAKALGHFQSLLDVYRSFTDVPEAIFYVGECYFFLDEREDARVRYDTIKTKYADTKHLGASLSRLEELAQMYFDEALKNYTKEWFFQAADKFEYMADRYKEYSRLDETLYLWGDALYREEDFQGAQAPLLRCRKDFPDSSWTLYSLYTLSHMRYKRERFNEAVRFYQELAGKSGFSSFEYNDAARYVSGMSYYRLSKYSSAVDIVQGMSGSGEYAIYGAYLEGLCLVKQNKLVAAIESFKKMANAPTYSDATERLNGRAHIILAYLYQRQGDTDAAWVEYDKISTSDVENWDDAQVGKAYILVRQGGQDNYNQVYTMMNTLLGRLPDTEMAPDASILMGYCQIQEGDYEKAIDTFADVVNSYSIARDSINTNPDYQRLVEAIDEELKYVNSIITHEIKDIRNSGGATLFPDELAEAEAEVREMLSAITELQTFISGRDIIGRDITDDAEFFRAYASFAHKEATQSEFDEVKMRYSEEQQRIAAASQELEENRAVVAADAEGRTVDADYEVKLAEREALIAELSSAHLAEFEGFVTTEEQAAAEEAEFADGEEIEGETDGESGDDSAEEPADEESTDEESSEELVDGESDDSTAEDEADSDADDIEEPVEESVEDGSSEETPEEPVEEEPIEDDPADEEPVDDSADSEEETS
ncbi:tetratricopeptide repeat protein, partial [bacterium]|nr:tetratricopeptide repeat protein [bacterium]